MFFSYIPTISLLVLVLYGIFLFLSFTSKKAIYDIFFILFNLVLMVDGVYNYDTGFGLGDAIIFLLMIMLVLRNFASKEYLL